MKDLITRLEEATEGSRELDAEIHCAITPGRIVHPKGERGYTQDDLLHEARNTRLAQAQFISRSRGPSPHYTTSIDAALTLVPEGCAWGCTFACGTSKPVASCGPWDTYPVSIRNAATPALALCIAALKARE